MVSSKNRVQLKLEINWGMILGFNTSETIPK